MIREIEAKNLFSPNKKPTSWFGTSYLFNIYRGCEHRCIYCNSRSQCYKVENFDDLIVKINAVELLKNELKSKRKKCCLGTGSMTDPYTISEKKYCLTRRCLQEIANYNYPIHITTKSNLILRDVDILEEINKIYASVAMTITTTNNTLARIVEPLAPSSTDRFKALGILSTLGICTSITMMPILPFIEDTEENIIGIVEKANYYGVKYIVPWLGMTLRDRQKAYYYENLDRNFPGLRSKYEKQFGNRYRCSPKNLTKLSYTLKNSCAKYGVSLNMPSYQHKMSSVQLNSLDKI